MKSLPIANDDPTIIELTPDQKVTALKGIKDMYHGLSYLHEMIEGDKLPIGMRDNMCGLLDHYLKELAEPVGYASQAAARIEEKHAEIRSLNGEIHELERKLGEAAPIDTVPNMLRNLHDGVRNWWSNQFGGWLHDFDYGPYGTINLKFNFSFDRSYVGSKTPVTDKSKKQLLRESLEEQGYIFVVDDNTYYLLDCDKNRELLSNLLYAQFPSIVIDYWENRHVRKTNKHALWGIKAYIRDFAELASVVNTKDEETD